MEIHHIGYLVDNICKAIDTFRVLGFNAGDVTRNEDRKIDVCFCENENNSIVIELISPYDEESEIANLMKKKDKGPYHLCFLSHDLYYDLNELKKVDMYKQQSFLMQSQLANVLEKQ